MEAGRTYRATAIVLRRISIGETERVLTLYTREKGKLSSVAKGTGRPLSKLSGATELFTYGLYFLGVGKDLDVLTQAEIRESFPGIRRDIYRIAHATYFVEMTSALVDEREPNYDLFDTLLSSLYLLEGQVDTEIVARYFELQVMSILGYRPELDTCVRCDAMPSTAEVAFSPSLGGRACPQCGPMPDDIIHLSGESAEAIRTLLSAEPQTLRGIELPDSVREQLRKTMHWHVRHRLDRDLKSAEFIRSLNAAETREQDLTD